MRELAVRLSTAACVLHRLWRMTHEVDAHEKHPDSPGAESVHEALNEPTRESMETLGRTRPDEAPDPRAKQGDDRESPPGQNSDWTPQ